MPESAASHAGVAMPPSDAAGSQPLADASASPPPSAAAPGAGVIPARWLLVGAVVLAVLATASLVLTWNTQQRVRLLEAELVKRQGESAEVATEARTLARQAEQAAREASARMALLEARVAESTLQRDQLEELIQGLARSRDESVLADLDAAVRLAMQQSDLTGSVQPLLLTLRQADERLARFNQPRLERVRRAVLADLERTRTAGITDVPALTVRLDELIRGVDDWPLLSVPERRSPAAARRAPASDPAPVAASAPAAAASGVAGWSERWQQRWSVWVGHVWQEARDLVRVTRIDRPEAMLLAPDQAYFLRENLKLRLLNARLALLSRQFDTAQSDLRDTQAALERYFDRSVRRVAVAHEQVRQISAQARTVSVPRPDATLTALAAAATGR